MRLWICVFSLKMLKNELGRCNGRFLFLKLVKWSFLKFWMRIILIIVVNSCVFMFSSGCYVF